MRKLLFFAFLTLTACTTPQQAATETCDCLHEVVRYWEDDEKLKATAHFADCGKMQEDHKNKFSGKDLIEFEREYKECLETTIKSEGLRYLLK